MDHIETAILNCYGIREAEQNMVFAARLTQHGHTIQNMADLMDLYRQSLCPIFWTNLKRIARAI